MNFAEGMRPNDTSTTSHTGFERIHESLRKILLETVCSLVPSRISSTTVDVSEFKRGEGVDLSNVRQGFCVIFTGSFCGAVERRRVACSITRFRSVSAVARNIWQRKFNIQKGENP